MWRLPEILFVWAAATVVVASPGRGAELYVGVAEADITPAQPMALWGQMHTRISKSVESPVTAQVVALESREGDRALDAAIMVSADIIGLPHEVLVALRKRVVERLPDFDAQKLFVSGTHIHTGPVFREGDYKVPKEGVIQPAEYAQFFVDRVSEAAAKAWQDRQKGAVAWGLGHAVVGQNRRAVYADGRAVMYGRTDQPDFRGLEGYEDHAVEVLFFFDRQKKLLAAAINLACTAQEVEGRSTVNADFFHEVREALREKHGRDLKILGWIGAAGDQSPHLMFRQRAEDRMRELRGLTRLQEIARRIGAAFGEAYDGAKQEIRSDVVLAHRVARLDLPVRLVTDEEAAAAKAKVEALSKDPAEPDARRVASADCRPPCQPEKPFHSRSRNPCAPPGRRGDCDQSLRTVRRFRRPNQGAQSRAADVCRAVGRRRGILADLAGGARRRVQRHCREQHGGPGGRAGTRRPHHRPDQVAVAGSETLSPVHLDLHVAPRRRKAIIVSARRNAYNRFRLFR